MKYLFQLGHQPDLSAAEIQEVVLSQKHGNTETQKTQKQGDKHYLIVETKNELDAPALMSVLGGTVKISQMLQVTSYKLQDQKIKVTKGLENEIINYLITTKPEGKIEFSLNDSKLALQVKKTLKSLGRSVRYIEPKNTATILYNGLVNKKTDLSIIDNEIYFTVAIQQFEEMAQRDYGRPGADDKSGMLPPKLARMMINLAMANVETHLGASQEKTRQGASLLDPFCGSGTVLTEALSMGYTNLIGSDISDKAIKDTEKNINWLSQQQFNNLTIKQYSNVKLFVSDVTKLSTHLESTSIDTIVTEPYLGKPLHGNENEFTIKKQCAELANLYIEAFKNFYKILKPGGTIVIVIPKFKYKNDWLKVDCVEKIKKTGFELSTFNSELSALTYHRPNQHLAREIYRFKKIPH